MVRPLHMSFNLFICVTTHLLRASDNVDPTKYMKNSFTKQKKKKAFTMQLEKNKRRFSLELFI